MLHTSCMYDVKAHASLCTGTDSHEHWLVDNAISSNIS